MNSSHALSTHQLTPPDFSIITIHGGTGEDSDHLVCAVASLADQDGIKSEHILQHSGGVTGLWNKLSKELALSKRTQRYTLRLLEEKSAPFYELLPRAMTRLAGSFTGFLQPEEQYLPGALIAVEKYFQAHPETDLLVTGALFYDEATKKMIPSPATPLSLEYFWTAHPQILPSTLFFRTTLLKKSFPLDSSYQNALLQEWLLRILQAGKKIAFLPMATTISPLKVPSNDSSPTLLPPPPASIKLLSPWWRLRHSFTARKAKRSLLKTQPCLGYQRHSLSQRTSLTT